MWLKKFIFSVLFLSCPVWVWAMGHGESSSDSSQGPLIGKPAPDVILSKTDGTSASVIGSRQGEKAILVFWATWCPHCYEELGKINDASAEVQRKGIKIILVDEAESKEDVQEYLIRRQIALSCFIDVDNALQDPYHLVGVPTLVFIDQRGIIRDVTHQFPSDYEDYFGGK